MNTKHEACRLWHMRSLWCSPRIPMTARTLAAAVDVINRGFSGYNSSWIAARLDQLLPLPAAAPRPAQPHVHPLPLATVFLGANDAALAEFSGQHVPLSTYEANVRIRLSSRRGSGSDRRDVSSR